jgi:hypothetical protein
VWVGAEELALSRGGVIAPEKRQQAGKAWRWMRATGE